MEPKIDLSDLTEEWIDCIVGVACVVGNAIEAIDVFHNAQALGAQWHPKGPTPRGVRARLPRPWALYWQHANSELLRRKSGIQDWANTSEYRFNMIVVPEHRAAGETNVIDCCDRVVDIMRRAALGFRNKYPGLDRTVYNRVVLFDYVCNRVFCHAGRSARCPEIDIVGGGEAIRKAVEGHFASANTWSGR